MRARFLFVMIAVATAVAAVVLILWPRNPIAPSGSQADQASPEISLNRSAVPSGPSVSKVPSKTRSNTESPIVSSTAEALTETIAPSTTKLERLAQIRQTFQSLAAANRASALRAAKQLTNANERETALFTLVVEWTQGELGSPRERADRVARYGIEAGLGMELAGNLELAMLWANELTQDGGRAELIGQTALRLVGSDPTGALQLADQLHQNERRAFFDSLFGGWAYKDTASALQWAEAIDDSAEREAALKAIRGVAPVGIGALLAKNDGYAVIQNLTPGSPAQISGQIQAGDRIIAFAQGDGPFVDARNISLNELVKMIRGEPGTTLQLQLLAADAPANSSPRIVPIVRDQIKFKH